MTILLLLPLFLLVMADCSHFLIFSSIGVGDYLGVRVEDRGVVMYICYVFDLLDVELLSQHDASFLEN